MLQKVLNAPTVSPRSSPPCPPCPEAAAEVRGDEPHLLDVNASDCSRSRLLCSPRFTTKLIDPILATRSLALLDKLQIALKVPSSLLETDKRTSLVCWYGAEPYNVGGRARRRTEYALDSAHRPDRRSILAPGQPWCGVPQVSDGLWTDAPGHLVSVV